MIIKNLLALVIIFVFNHFTIYLGTLIFVKKNMKIWNPFNFIFTEKKFPIIYIIYFVINCVLFIFGLVSLFLGLYEIQKRLLQIISIFYFIILGTTGIYMLFVKDK